MKKHVLIFDFDGTIADTFLTIVKISNQLADEFHFNKIDPQNAEQMKNNTVKETIQQLKVPLLKIPLIVARAKEELLREIKEIHPIPGLSDILHQLYKLNVPMGILTSNSQNNVEEFLRNHSLQIFRFVSTSSKIWSKNHSLIKLISKQNLNLEDIVYIGDEARDIEAAKRLGIKVAAVTWGYNSLKTLEALHPDFLFTQPQDLLKLVS